MGEGEAQLKQYSLEEVEKYKKGGQEKDVWIVIHDLVYDVTKFLDEHPGGEEVLFDVSGLDGTEAFEDVGHSTDARELMKDYLIGQVQESDRKGTEDKGPKVWAENTMSATEEGSSWMTWLVPAALAFMGSIFYRTYFARD